MKKIILLSVVIHGVLLILLAPLIKTRMEFDEKEEEQRTAEVMKRELERKEQDRLRREKQKLDDKMAEALKREAEFRKKKELKKQVRELREKRDEIMERRERELAKFRERTRKDVMMREQAMISKMARDIKEQVRKADEYARQGETVFGRFTDGNRGALKGWLDDVSVSRRIWSTEEIRSGDPVVIDSDYLWDFESGPVEVKSGRKVSLTQNSKIAEREDGKGMALNLESSQALTKVGPVDYGDAFTIAVSVFAQSRGETEQVVLTNNHSSDWNSSLQLMVVGEEGEGRVIYRTTGQSRNSAISSTEPGSFVFGQWNRVVVTTDTTTDKVKIYINGEEMEMPEAELAEDLTTDALDLSELSDLAEETIETLMNEDLDTTEVPEVLENLDELGSGLADAAEAEEDNGKLRNQLKGAESSVNEMREALGGLGEKGDMDRMNDTDSAKADEVAGKDSGKNAGKDGGGSAEMYSEAERLEEQIAEAKADIDAASEAVAQNTSYQEAREKVMAATPERPDLAEVLGAGAPETVGDLNEFREGLTQAENEMQDMNARADAALGRTEQKSLTASSFQKASAMASAAQQTGQYGTVVDMTSFAGGSKEGESGGMREDSSDAGEAMKFAKVGKPLRLSEGKIIENAMPGRRFTDASTRKGWLYLDTWYVIGPWENDSTVDYTIKHPPEFGIDLDATYYDGKFAKEDGHPLQELRWEFYQSDQIRCQPPMVYGASTYYAYTDVWFERARDMLIAVASDDAATVWLNGQVIWQDTGRSAWRLGEGYRKVHFKEGYNDVLVRIENGPQHCIWSVVLCPPEVLPE